MSALAVEWVNQTDAAIDEKLGLITVKMPFVVTPGETKLATLRHALTFIPPDVRDLGLPLMKRNVKERDDGSYLVEFNHDGVFNPLAAGGEEFTLDGSTEEEKIEAHPYLDILVAKYFPPGTTLKSAVNSDGRIIFPVSLVVNGEEVPNPLHGISTYLIPHYIWTRTFVAVNFPTGLARQLGKIGNPPVGAQGQTPPRDGGPEWILARLKADWRGNIWKIAETWLNSGPNGFPPDVYEYR